MLRLLQNNTVQWVGLSIKWFSFLDDPLGIFRGDFDKIYHNFAYLDNYMGKLMNSQTIFWGFFIQFVNNLSVSVLIVYSKKSVDILVYFNNKHLIFELPF